MKRPAPCPAYVSQIACLLFLLASAVAAGAQQYQVIHNFSGQGDGGSPYTGLTAYHGKFIGTSYSSIFTLESSGNGWVLSRLVQLDVYPYSGGYWPMGKVTVGPDGALYGTTYLGGILGACPDGNGCGVVYRLQPPLAACHSVQCPWTETVIHTFTGGADGGNPVSEVVFDNAGNLYGTAPVGGNMACPSGCGVVYKMSPAGGGNWTQTVIYNFTGGTDGYSPQAGLIFDQAGNLYGVANGGGQVGVLFKLTPSNGEWTETTLHSFQLATDGGGPEYSLIADAAGNFYGTTTGGGINGGGTAFEYSHAGTFSLLYSFDISYGEPSSPSGSLLRDAAGNFFGTTAHGGIGFLDFGSIFEISPSGGGWQETDLYHFDADGIFPFGAPVLDQQGRLYGTTSMGGSCCGVVWQLTP